jgi:tetratricopeptide (TPR) repeat protein
VVARYPDSKYRDDALLLQGQALLASGQCRPAVAPLARAVNESPEVGVRDRARLALGRCQVDLGDMAGAIATLSPLTASGDSAQAQQARLWRGRALLAQGDYQVAATDLEAAGPVADFELAVVYARLEQPEQARRVLEERVAAPYIEAPWLALLDTLGEASPEVAASMVDRLVGRGDLAAVEQGRLLMADGDRWLHTSRPRAARVRYERARLVAGETPIADSARVRSAIAALRAAAGLSDVPVVLDSIEATEASRDDTHRVATYAASLRVVLAVTAARSAELDEPVDHPDLALFLAAEALRDAMDAPMLAAAVFREVQRRFPHSVIAPKALLASTALDSTGTGTVLVLLQKLYPQSPYTRAASGSAGAAFMQLEDSLRSLLVDLRVARGARR